MNKNLNTLIALGVVATLLAIIYFQVRPDTGESSRASPAASGGAASAAGANPPSSQAAGRPDTYPSGELVAACDTAAASLRRKLDNTFNTLVEPPFVIAGDAAEPRLRSWADSCVSRPARAMWKAYFKHRPDHVITVLLFGTDKSYRLWAKKLFGDEDVSHFGYYKPDKRTMVMNIATGGGTLIHELTHALIEYDFGNVPRWFNEGLGSLHEQCRVGDDDITGLENWRLPDLQKAVKAGALRPLRDMVTKDDFYGAQRGLNYAQSRYFVMYMQKQGLLKTFYSYYHDHHDGDDSAVKAIEHVFAGRKIDDVEKDYLAWVKTLKFP